MAEMNSYYNWCMFFLSVIGLWPYCNKKFRLLHNSIISLITWSSVISQFATIFAVDKDLFQHLRDLSTAEVAVAALTKYHATWYQINDIWQANSDLTKRYRSEQKLGAVLI
ncbi:uncharacterized protein LOC105662052 [Megachile rotundata]|uniref:uncharacterized protein LOC105662052 n=1 Tax=Megachile rotundata TaxID=143995 RepID=UPI003FD09C3E